MSVSLRLSSGDVGQKSQLLNVFKYILVFGIFEIQGNFENPKKM